MKSKLFKYSLLAIVLCLLGIRGYGYFVDDQSELIIYSLTFADSGKLVSNLTEQPMIGTMHPPFLVIFLALAIKVTNVFFGPPIVQLICTILTLLLLLKCTHLKYASDDFSNRSFALILLFFLLPFTHESFLYIDIDNTVLVVWSALFILGSISSSKSVVRHSLFMGSIFAIGLWCKLTTPIVVFCLWSLLQLIEKLSWGTIARIISVAVIAGVLFLGTYIPFCLLYDTPVWYPFTLTFGKGAGFASGLMHISERLGTILRSIYLDIHWFSVVLFFIAGYKTFNTIKEFTWKRADLKQIYPTIYFWCLYICYTIIVPTIWFPRYKFILLPFVVWWLHDDFYQFVKNTKPLKLMALIVCGLGLSMVLPDLGTSATNYKLYFHSHTLFRSFLQGVLYYPQGLTETMHQLAIWSKHSLIRSPVGLFCFVFYFITWAGCALILLNVIAVYAIYLKNKNIMRSLFILAILLWTSQFAQNMRRDYALFYCAGTQGFNKIIPEFKSRLKPDEPFIGNKEFSAYTGNPFYFLNQWGDREQEIDTTRLRDLVASHQIRYLIYLNIGEAVKGLSFKKYLQENFSLDCQRDDYFLWKKK